VAGHIEALGESRSWLQWARESTTHYASCAESSQRHDECWPSHWIWRTL